jgi:hypothetical protein
MLCNSYKNSKSTERCPSKALKNLSFCGKHAKVKTPRLWTESKPNIDCAIKIQKWWRGSILRYILSLAGPGVLNRKKCHNEEDVVTCIEKERVHPLNYFAFEEDGKIFWFDLRSLFQLCLEKLQPENPYTRQKLSLETRKRFKEYTNFRKGYLFHDPLYLQDRDKVIAMRWMLICQMLEESLFIDLSPMFFVALNRTQLWEFTAILRTKLLNWAKEHNTIHSRRNIYYVWISTCFRRQTLEVATTNQVCYYLGGALLKILKDVKIPYDMCLKILEARHSL